jgi:hypothetical protein
VEEIPDAIKKLHSVSTLSEVTEMLAEIQLLLRSLVLWRKEEGKEHRTAVAEFLRKLKAATHPINFDKESLNLLEQYQKAGDKECCRLYCLRA